jgi:energy-converting hydrogenase Eha subunit C
VLYLWSGNTLPDSIASKSYVHQGVNALMATVLLSALVLTAIFHQALEVARRRELKALAGFWIAQNFFLMLSVGLRVKNYIVDYNMTVLRLSVIIFLLLVAVGFILLSIKIMKERSLSWLVGGCVLAVFVTFYLTQFLDLAGWSANYNCARWAQDRGWNPQFHEFREAGPAAWPALRRAHELDPTVVVINDDPNAGFVNRDSVTLARFDGQHWREFSLRAWLNRWALEDKK